MSESGNMRADAFLDGDHFSVMVKKGQAPVRAVAHALARRLKAPDIQLWPAEPTPAGQAFRATWFDKDAEVFREGRVEIWNIYRRPVERNADVARHGNRRRHGDEKAPPTMTIRGREYRVETKFEPKDEKKLRYILHGARGAKYTTMRNVRHPELMFIINERRFGPASVMDGVWLTDKDGTLRVASQ